MYNVAKRTDTATMDTSPVTGVLLGNVYSVGPPSSRNASNHPLIVATYVSAPPLLGAGLDVDDGGVYDYGRSTASIDEDQGRVGN